MSEFGAFFVVLRTACFSVQGQRGGVPGKSVGVYRPHIP